MALVPVAPQPEQRQPADYKPAWRSISLGLNYFDSDVMVSHWDVSELGAT